MYLMKSRMKGIVSDKSKLELYLKIKSLGNCAECDIEKEIKVLCQCLVLKYKI